MEVPLPMVAVGVIAAPIIAALGALAAFAGEYKIVERKE